MEANKSPHPQGSSSTSSMIGPTPTFYTEGDNALQHADDHPHYRQWIESYNSGQPPPPMPMQSAYGRDVVHPPPQQPSQGPYDSYMGVQYSSNSMGHYATSSSATAMQSNMGPSAYQSQPGDMYPAFYPNPMATSTTSSPDQAQSYHPLTPDSTLHSYSTTPDPVYQQQQAQTTYQPHQPPPPLPPPPHNLSHQRPPAPQRSLHSKPPRSQTRFMQHQPNDHTSQSNLQSSPSNPPTLAPPSTTWNSKQTTTSVNQPFKVPKAPPARGAGLSRPNAPPLQQSTGGHSSSFSSVVASTSTVTPEKTGRKRKWAKKEEGKPPSSQFPGDYSGSGSDEDEDRSGLAMTGSISVGMGGLGVAQRPPKRGGGKQ